jgi:hypothetical protein
VTSQTQAQPSRPSFPMNRFFTIILFGSVLFALPLITEGQTVRIDATPSHVANKFRPIYALGSTVDRVPSNATDTFFRPDQIKQSFPQAGASSAIARTPICSCKPGTGNSKALGAILPAKDISSETQHPRKKRSPTLTAIPFPIAASPETTEQSLTGSLASTTATCRRTGKAIPT